jgi:hypothetical protein
MEQRAIARRKISGLAGRVHLAPGGHQAVNFQRRILFHLPFGASSITCRGTPAAVVGALAGPLIASAKNPGVYKPAVLPWNILMRFLVLQLCVQFVEQIRKLNKLSRPRTLLNPRPGKFSENWAVVLACALLFLAVAAVDFVTDPHMIFLPLYLLPCIILTLALNRRWGMASALVMMMVSSLVEYSDHPDYGWLEVFGWNFVMRLVIAFTVVLLLDCIRKENILFLHRKTNGG